MYRIGCSTCGRFPDRELFAAYREAGLDAMEISLKWNRYGELDYEELSALSGEFGIELWSFHLPFSPFDKLDISKPSLAADSVSYLSSLIEKATSIGIARIVIHASGEPIAEEEREERMACAKRSLATLAELASSRGATLAVEDLPRTCLGRDSDDILELLGAHPSLRVCYDTNHLLSEDAETFIARVGDRIVTTHVSDYDFKNERHWLPGEGDVKWQSILASLRDASYEGVWMYELGLAAPATIERPRDLTYEDFVRNARELFDGSEPTVIGTRVEGLEGWK